MKHVLFGSFRAGGHRAPPAARVPAKVTEQLSGCIIASAWGLRDLDLILAAPGVVVSYETIRDRNLRFGRLFVLALKGDD